MALERQRAIVEEHVADARARGARVLVGGEKPGGPGFYYPPTVLTEVDHSMRIMREETFGPVLPIMAVDSLEEAVRLANDSDYGLTASGWTRSAMTARRLQQGLVAGVVTINDCVSSYGEPTAPWGGVKRSGIGRTHGGLGLRENLVRHHIDDGKSLVPVGIRSCASPLLKNGGHRFDGKFVIGLGAGELAGSVHRGDGHVRALSGGDGLVVGQRRLGIRHRHLVVVGIELGEDGAGLDVLVVVHPHAAHIAGDARADRIHVSVDLRVVGGLRGPEAVVEEEGRRQNGGRTEREGCRHRPAHPSPGRSSRAHAGAGHLGFVGPQGLGGLCQCGGHDHFTPR